MGRVSRVLGVREAMGESLLLLLLLRCGGFTCERRLDIERIKSIMVESVSIGNFFTVITMSASSGKKGS